MRYRSSTGRISWWIPCISLVIAIMLAKEWITAEQVWFVGQAIILIILYFADHIFEAIDRIIEKSQNICSAKEAIDDRRL